MATAEIFQWVAFAVNTIVCVGISIPSSIRAMRERRYLRIVQNHVWAYEKELRARGVTLPARCCHCCQLLPRHVEGCEFADLYEAYDTLMERITRPPQYNPTGR